MSIQKIKAGRVKSVNVDDFVGDKGTLFYDEDFGDLRLSDGVTVGGIPLSAGKSSSGSTPALLTPTMPPVGRVGCMWYNTDTSTLYISQGSSWVPVTSPDAGDIDVYDIPLGNGLYVSPTGELSVDFSVIEVPVASSDAFGVVKVGSGLSIDQAGVLNVDFPDVQVPYASESSYGVVKVGSGLSIDQTGELSVDYTTTTTIIPAAALPPATTTVMGAVKVGSGLAVTNTGFLNIDITPDDLPLATTTNPGVITLGPGLGLTEDGAVTVTVYTNNDGGTPVSNYGGITPYDGGGVI